MLVEVRCGMSRVEAYASGCRTRWWTGKRKRGRGALWARQPLQRDRGRRVDEIMAACIERVNGELAACPLAEQLGKLGRVLVASEDALR